MASKIYNSFADDEARGNIVLDGDTFGVILVTAGYTPDIDAHTKRSDITNEVAATGYTAGGNTVSLTVTKDTTNDREDIGLGGTSWAAATITAAGAVYFKKRGGAASADELIAFIDFGGDVSSTNDTFTLNASTLRMQNLAV